MIYTHLNQDKSFKQEEKVETYLNCEQTTVKVNNTITLSAGTIPNNENVRIEWNSDNPNVLSVDNGVVFGISSGKSLVTATFLDYGETKKCEITVVEKTIDVQNITINKSKIELKAGNKLTLKASISPSNATNKNIAWSSSNENVAKVNNGVVAAIIEGTTTITAKTDNGKTATCKVVVRSIKKFDRIHFIGHGTAFSSFVNGSNVSGTGPSPSNTILLESNGKFALIDTGLANNDSLNPNRTKNVVNYLKKVGVKELEFILITHVHYDHMGGATYILDNIPTKKLYMKVYYANDSSSGSAKTNNINRYNALYNKATSLGIFEKINANKEGNLITLGNMNINLYATKNMQYYEACYGEDENINSVITYITINGKKILLPADMEPTSTTCLKKFNSSCSGKSITQCVISKNNIKNIDLLELSHHGYSSCDINSGIISKLNPKNLVINNLEEKVKYYYSGITNSLGNKVGPVYGSSTSCINKYFSGYATSDSNKNVFYVENNNLVFDFSNSTIKTYNN